MLKLVLLALLSAGLFGASLEAIPIDQHGMNPTEIHIYQDFDSGTIDPEYIINPQNSN